MSLGLRPAARGAAPEGVAFRVVTVFAGMGNNRTSYVLAPVS